MRINPVIKINYKGENKLGHTAPFPEDIPEMTIKFFSGIGDTVLDIFMESGTTDLVSKKLKRNYIGFELNSNDIKMANKRIQEAVII